MKLLIKDEYYRRIKLGEKNVDFRDSHITFINEDSKKTLRKNVTGVRMIRQHDLPTELIKSRDITGELIIVFELEQRCSECGHGEIHNAEGAQCSHIDYFDDGDDRCDCPGEEKE